MTPRRTPLFVEFSGQEYWSGLPFPSPGDLPVPGIEPRSPALQADSLLSEPPGKPSSATKEAIMQQVEKAHSLQRRPRAAKKKSMYYTHTHTHTHTRKGFNACLSIPIHYQKPWFYAVKFILGTWTSGRELWQSQPHVSREAGHVASAQACLEEMVSSFLLLVEATLPNATRTLHF